MLKKEERDDKIEGKGERGEKVYREEIEERRREAKRTIRDSIFAKLFRDKENILRLYKRLHPEDTDIEVEDIENVTLETVLVNGMYNDLGFNVKDKEGRVRKIVMVEAQTKWDKNMPERMSVYAQNTRENFWLESGQKYHQKRKMHTPYFEHYMIYTGEGKEKECMRLHDFDVPEHSMNLGIKVITEIDDTICGQYIGFCKVYTKSIKNNPKDKRRALEETIRICKEKNYLKEFLENNEREVEDSMSIFFNQATAVEDYGDEREEIGRKEGEKIGRKEGEKIGRKEGEKIGRKEGEKIGREEAIERAIKVFLAKGKEKMKVTAEEFGMTISEYIEMCAKSMKIRKEDLIGICAKSMGMTVDKYKAVYEIS